MNRDSGTDVANRRWLRRIVRPMGGDLGDAILIIIPSVCLGIVLGAALLRVMENHPEYAKILNNTANHSHDGQNQNPTCNLAILGVESSDGALKLLDGAGHLYVIDGQSTNDIGGLRSVSKHVRITNDESKVTQIPLLLLWRRGENSSISERTVQLFINSGIIFRVHNSVTNRPNVPNSATPDT